jgi:hypothetical protein
MDQQIDKESLIPKFYQERCRVNAEAALNTARAANNNMFLGNGGAILALLAFIGSVHGEKFISVHIIYIVLALGSFVLGFICAIIMSLCMSYRMGKRSNQWEAKADAYFKSPAESCQQECDAKIHEKFADCYRKWENKLFFASGFFLIVGAIFVAISILSQKYS